MQGAPLALLSTSSSGRFSFYSERVLSALLPIPLSMVKRDGCRRFQAATTFTLLPYRGVKTPMLYALQDCTA